MKLFAFVVIIGAFALATVKSSEEPLLLSFKELLLSENRSAITITQCFVESVAKVSNANGLNELWAQSEAIIQNNLNSWSQCPVAGNKFKQIICNIKEGVHVFKALFDYLSLIGVQNPQLIKFIALEYYSNCSPASAPFEQLLLNSVTDIESMA